MSWLREKLDGNSSNLLDSLADIVGRVVDSVNIKKDARKRIDLIS